MKNFGGFVVSLLVFAFVCMLTPTMTDAINAASLSEPTASFISVFPMIFLVVAALFPVFVIVKEREK